MITRSGLTIARTLGGDSHPMSSFEMPDFPPGALCVQMDAEMFFPEKGASVHDAKRACRMCPVREACLAKAMENGETHGVWGGLSAKERRTLRSRTYRETAA